MNFDNIELKQKEDEIRYKKNVRYKKIRRIGIFLSILITIVFIIINLTKKDEKNIFSMEILSKLTEKGIVETREEIEYSGFSDNTLKRIIPYNRNNIENLDIRVVQKEKEDSENVEKEIKAEEITKKQYDTLTDEEKEEKLYYYLGYTYTEDKLENSNIKNKVSYKTKKELEKTNELKKQNENSENSENQENTANEQKTEEAKEKEQVEETNSEEENKTEENQKEKNKVIVYIPVNKKVRQTYKVVINYIIKDSVIAYKDTYELNGNVIEEKDPGILKRLNLEMEFPKGGIKKENGKVYFTGIYDGKAEISSNKVKLEIRRDLNYHEGLKFKVLFQEPKLSDEIKKEDKEYLEVAKKTYSGIKESENKEIEKYLNNEKNVKNINNGIIYGSALIFAIIFVKLGIDILSEIGRRQEIESVIKSFKYYDNPPEEFKFNFSKIDPLMEEGQSAIFKSVLLKLIYKGLLIPEKQKKVFSLASLNNLTEKISKNNNKKTLNKRTLSDDVEIEYFFTLDTEDFERQDSLGYILNEDRYIFNILKDISLDNKFALSELTKYIKENYRTTIKKDLSKLIYIEKEKLTENRYFEKDTNKKDLKILRQNTINILILLIFLVLSIIFNKEYTFPIYISIFSFIIAILNSVKQKIHLKGINARGLQAEAQIKGFRNFIRDSSFLDLKVDSKKDINKVRQYLMYSVYFGMRDKFLNKTFQYNDVNYRRIYKDLEEEENKSQNKDEEEFAKENELKFKYKDVDYLIKKIDESIAASKNYYNVAIDTINLFDSNKSMPKRNLKLKSNK